MLKQKHDPIDITYHPIKSHHISDREYRLYREAWNNYPLNGIVSNFPLHLDIEINTGCNLKCNSCGFHSKEANSQFYIKEEDYMPFKVFKRIIDEGVREGLKAIKLNYRGEPLMHPLLTRFVSYAKEKGVIDVMFNTNGILLNSMKARELIKAGLDKISLSIDDHRPEVYNKLRAPGKFQTVMSNLYSLKIMRDIMGRQKPIIRINKVNCPENEQYNDAYCHYFRDLCEELGFQECLDLHSIWMNHNESSYFCAFPWQRLMILVDGSIYTCCNLPMPHKMLGYIDKMSIKEAWHSPKMQILREQHQAGRSHLMAQCVTCPMRHKLM